MTTQLEPARAIRRTQRVMIAHGMLILLVGLVAGVGLLISLVGGLEIWPGRIISLAVPGESAAWGRLHLGQILNAFLIVLAALALPVVDADAAFARRLGWMFVGTGWANTAFYLAALHAPNRALTFGANRWGAGGLAATLGLAPALVFAFITIVAVVMLAWRALRAAA
jgi:hypothetical protein